jgi:Zn finger protein HypA/HybF involved in hydrogenase expression
MTTKGLSQADHEALERALQLACRESTGQAARFEEMLRSKPWREVCERAVYHLQVKTLRLKPWQCPPCDCRSDEIGQGYGCSASEVKLRRHMLRLGISLYEPDPRAAIERAESARRNARVVGNEKKSAHPVA